MWGSNHWFFPLRDFALLSTQGNKICLVIQNLQTFYFIMQSFLGVFWQCIEVHSGLLYREESQANPYYGPICIVSANENNGQEIISRIDFSFLIHTLEVQILKSHLLYGQLDRTSALIQLYNSNPDDRITFSWPLVDQHGR